MNRILDCSVYSNVHGVEYIANIHACKHSERAKQLKYVPAN